MYLDDIIEEEHTKTNTQPKINERQQHKIIKLLAVGVSVTLQHFFGVDRYFHEFSHGWYFMNFVGST